MNLYLSSYAYLIYPTIIDALGGVKSPLLEDYIRLKLVGYTVIEVTLNEDEDAIGLVGTHSCGQLRDSIDQYLKEFLDFYRPGLVDKITEDFDKKWSQTQKLHDLAKLLGAKEKEYQHLTNIDLTAEDFQKYVEQALNKNKDLTDERFRKPCKGGQIHIGNGRHNI